MPAFVRNQRVSFDSEPEASNLSPASGEFASKEWLTYLVERKISFRLRIKAKYADYRQTRAKDSRLEDVEDNEEGRAGGVAEKTPVVEQVGICGGLPQRRRR